MPLPMIDFRKALAVFSALAMTLAIVAIALHFPGQISMDTSMQLYEAQTGRSVSWAPPFMSALMRWLGGSERGTAGVVVICSLLTYLSLAMVANSALRLRAAAGQARLSILRVTACVLLLLNPVLLIYVGIVWKDVLFSSAMSAAVALSFAAAAAEGRRALAWAAMAAALLAMALQIRQQGIFMAPLLLGLPILAVAAGRQGARARRIGAASILVATFVLSLLVTQALVAQSIANSGDKSHSVGFRNIMLYDIAGIVARSGTPTAALPVAITPQQREAVRSAYSSERIDYLIGSREAMVWLDSIPDNQRARVWRKFIRREPTAFLEHKWFVFLALLDVNGIDGCLPMHVGVSGNADYLRAEGIAEGSNARAIGLYAFAEWFFDWPLFRHWFYALVLLAAVATTLLTVMPARLKGMCLVLAFATAAFYLSYLPTSIACDFRYLYGAIPLITMLWLVLLAGGLRWRWPGTSRTQIPQGISP